MRRTLSAALLVLLSAAAPAADDKAPARKPVGTWEREVGAIKVTFKIEPDKIRCQFNGGDVDGYVIDSRYGVTPDGILFGVVTKVEKAQGVEKGELYSFNFKVENGTLTVNDLKSTADVTQAKQLIQGEYKKVP